MEGASPGPIDRVWNVRRVDADTIEMELEKDGRLFTVRETKDRGRHIRLSDAAFDELERQLRARIT